MNKIALSVVLVLLISTMVAIPASAKEYQVKKGDNLWTIARNYDTTVKKLKELNNLKSDIIYPNQKLQIESKKDNEYKVKKGDTLSHIALDYGVSVRELKQWNNLSSDLILIDQLLSIQRTGEGNRNSTTATESTTTFKQANSSSKTMTMTATAYTAECDGCSGITYTGINLLEDRNKKVIAVDPNVIPLGSEVYVEGYGRAIAGDIGGAIKGNRIDIHVPTKREAFAWGVRRVEVEVLE
ncbi:3D domain-containing protein [Aquibacillus albus]|uniref:3D (Asp-Asp-Asp) domain-containing protein n=1 Tax=Aquibacillus albus TaxID=1168171 RepID=A0ABS2MXN7_9BACI|nr:3D domain-containing protein [Aquibacillus albus]MBM7570625.1 3D (Asp-Asp-Asp) domain-containing protein [Aquibacillus albus]